MPIDWLECVVWMLVITFNIITQSHFVFICSFSFDRNTKSRETQRLINTFLFNFQHFMHNEFKVILWYTFCVILFRYYCYINNTKSVHKSKSGFKLENLCKSQFICVLLVLNFGLVIVDRILLEVVYTECIKKQSLLPSKIIWFENLAVMIN